MSVEEGAGDTESGRGHGLSDCDVDDACSEAGKSTCSSTQPFSPNPSESDDLGDCDGKRGKGRRRGDGSARLSTYPMSERQQLALLKQITAPGQDTESPKSPVQTPGSAGRPRGKKIHRRNEKGETALHICARKGEYSQCRRLLQEGADVNSVDYAGWTSLHEAANHGWYKTARVLLKGGANVNACASTSGDTPLHDAVASGRKKLVLLFLRHGAAREIVNKEGKRPIDCVDPDNDNEEIRRILKGELDQELAAQSSSSEEEFSDVDSVSTMSPKCFQSTPTHSGLPKPKVLSMDDTPPAQPQAASTTAPTSSSTPTPTTSVNLGTTPKRDSPMQPPSVIVDMSRKRFPDHSGLLDFGGISPGAGGNKKTADTLGGDKGSLKTLSVAISESPAESFHVGASFSPIGDRSSASPRVVLSPLIPSPTPSSASGSHTLLPPPVPKPAPKTTPPEASAAPTTPVTKRRTTTAGVRTALSPQAAAVRNLRKREQLRKRQSSFKQTSPAKKPRRLENRAEKPSRSGPHGPGDVYDFHDSDSELDSPEVTELNLKPFASKTFPPVQVQTEPTTGNVAKIETVSPKPEIMVSPTVSDKPDPSQKPSPTIVEVKKEVVEEEPEVTENTAKDPPIQQNEPEERIHETTDSPKDEVSKVKEVSKTEVDPTPIPSAPTAQQEEQPGATETDFKRSPTEAKDEEQPGNTAPKVPPLRIIISRSGSDEEVGSEASGGLTRQSNSAHPYVVKHSEETCSESGSLVKEGSVASHTVGGRGAGKAGGREPTRRMTRSKVKQEGVKLEPGVAYINTRAANASEDGQGGNGGSAMNMPGSGAPKKRIARRTLGGAVEPVAQSGQFQPHWSQSSSASQTAAIVSKNSYQAYKNLRIIVENKWNTGGMTGSYEAPRNYDKFMISKKDYLLQRNFKKEAPPRSGTPQHLDEVMSDLFVKQEEARNNRRLQHRLERERLILACEREVLRIHARESYKGEQLPLSAVRVFRDAELCNPLELDRPSLLSPNNLSAQESQLPLQTLVNNLLTKFQRRKVELIGRQRMEAQGLQAEQQMSWESQLRKSKLLDFFQAWKPNPTHVPAVQVVEDFDLLPADS